MIGIFQVIMPISLFACVGSATGSMIISLNFDAIRSIDVSGLGEFIGTSIMRKPAPVLHSGMMRGDMGMENMKPFERIWFASAS